MEESYVPSQILIGSMDRHYCILLALDIFVEAWWEAALSLGKENHFGECGISKHTKGTIYKILKEVWGLAEFVCLTMGPLGIHEYLLEVPETHATLDPLPKAVESLMDS